MKYLLLILLLTSCTDGQYTRYSGMQCMYAGDCLFCEDGVNYCFCGD